MSCDFFLKGCELKVKSVEIGSLNIGPGLNSFSLTTPGGLLEGSCYLPPGPGTLGFPGGSDGKASACNVGDPSLIPGLGRSPGDEMAIHSSTLAWKITWTEEPDRPQSMGSQRVEHD